MNDATYAILISKRVHVWASENVQSTDTFITSRVKDAFMQIGSIHIERAIEILLKEGRIQVAGGSKRLQSYKVAEYLFKEETATSLSSSLLPSSSSSRMAKPRQPARPLAQRSLNCDPSAAAPSKKRKEPGADIMKPKEVIKTPSQVCVIPSRPVQDIVNPRVLSLCYKVILDLHEANKYLTDEFEYVEEEFKLLVQNQLNAEEVKDMDAYSSNFEKALTYLSNSSKIFRMETDDKRKVFYRV